LPDYKRRRLQSSKVINNVLDRGSSGTSHYDDFKIVSPQEKTITESVSEQACKIFESSTSSSDVATKASFVSGYAQSSGIGMVGHLGLPRGLAIGDDDGAVAGVPSWLTRLFHPPEL